MKNLLTGVFITGVFLSFSTIEKKESLGIRPTVEKKETSIKFSDIAGVDVIQHIQPTIKAVKLEREINKPIVEVIEKPKVFKNNNMERLFNEEPVSDLNYQIDHWNVEELRVDMYRHQFRNLDNLDKKTLKEVRMAYYYDKLLWDVHERTGLGIGVVWAFLRIEAFTPQINESSLLRNGWNFGGIKYSKKLHKSFVLAKDDCGKDKCRFANFQSYNEGMEAWAAVFNAPRYKNCKSQETTFGIFNCIYRAGYHTANNVQTRKELCERYWKLKAYFPLNI